MIQRNGLGSGVKAVAEGGLEVDDARHAEILGGPRDGGRADGIGQRVALPFGRVGIGRRRMDDHVRREVLDRGAHRLDIGDRSLDEIEISVAAMLGEIVAPSGQEIVDRDDLVAACEETVDRAGADQAGAAGDENLHCISIVLRRPARPPRRMFRTSCRLVVRELRVASSFANFVSLRRSRRCRSCGSGTALDSTGFAGRASARPSRRPGGRILAAFRSLQWSIHRGRSRRERNCADIALSPGTPREPDLRAGSREPGRCGAARTARYADLEGGVMFRPRFAPASPPRDPAGT